MAHLKIHQYLSAALLILLINGAVFACTLAEGSTGDEIVAESLFALRTYHAISLLFTIIIGFLVVLKKGKGWHYLILPTLLMVMSPGWFAMANAGIDPMCGPSFAFEMKAILIMCLLSFLIQLFFWFRKSSKNVA